MSTEQHPITPNESNPTTERVPHSNVHHNEPPYLESDVPLQEGLYRTPTSPADLEDSERESFFRRHRGKIAGVVVTNIVVLGGGSFLYVKKNFTDPINDALEKPSAAGPAVAGQEPVETIEEPKDFYQASEEVNDLVAYSYQDPETGEWIAETYETVKSPMTLSQEQVAAWQSGDPEAQNRVADEVFLKRMYVAFHDIEQARGGDQAADLAFLNNGTPVDADVEKRLNTIADYFAQHNPDYGTHQVETPEKALGYGVGQTDTSGMDEYSPFSPSYYPENFKGISFADNGPMQWVVVRTSPDHTTGYEDGDVAWVEDIDLRLQLDGDTLTLQPLN